MLSKMNVSDFFCWYLIVLTSYKAPKEPNPNVVFVSVYMNLKKMKSEKKFASLLWINFIVKKISNYSYTTAVQLTKTWLSDYDNDKKKPLRLFTELESSHHLNYFNFYFFSYRFILIFQVTEKYAVIFYYEAWYIEILPRIYKKMCNRVLYVCCCFFQMKI